MAQCCATTRSGGWSRYACSRQAQPGSKYCFQHDPVKIAAKREEERKKWVQEMKARDQARQVLAANKEREQRYREQSEIALRKIVDGHNDPRKLARAVLKILKE